MEIKEIRLKSSKDLSCILVDSRKELISMVFQKRLGQFNNIARFSVVKKTIARILTVLNERKERINV